MENYTPKHTFFSSFFRDIPVHIHTKASIDAKKYVQAVYAYHKDDYIRKVIVVPHRRKDGILTELEVRVSYLDKRSVVEATKQCEAAIYYDVLIDEQVKRNGVRYVDCWEL